MPFMSTAVKVKFAGVWLSKTLQSIDMICGSIFSQTKLPSLNKR